jgi:hypothetical protein
MKIMCAAGARANPAIAQAPAGKRGNAPSPGAAAALLGKE